MKYLPILLALAIGCLAPFPPQRPTEAPSDDLPKIVESVVGLTSNGRPYCAGALHKNMVLTAAHCVDGREEAEVGFFEHYDGYNFYKTYTFSKAHFDEEQDLAILTPLVLIPQQGGLKLSPDQPRQGEKVVVIGHPRGLGYSVITGIVSYGERVVRGPEGMRWMQISTPVYPGNSGGPVVNQYGEILGLVSFYIRSGPDAQNSLAGAVHLKSIQEALEGI